MALINPEQNSCRYFNWLLQVHFKSFNICPKGILELESVKSRIDPALLLSLYKYNSNVCFLLLFTVFILCQLSHYFHGLTLTEQRGHFQSPSGISVRGGLRQNV